MLLIVGCKAPRSMVKYNLKFFSISCVNVGVTVDDEKEVVDVVDVVVEVVAKEEGDDDDEEEEEESFQYVSWLRQN